MNIGLYGGYHKSTGPLAHWNRWKVKLPQLVEFDWNKFKHNDIVSLYPSEMGSGHIKPGPFESIKSEVQGFLDVADTGLKRICISEELGRYQDEVLEKLTSWVHIFYNNLKVIHNYGYWIDLHKINSPWSADGFSLHYYSASNGGTNRDTIRRKFDQYSNTGKPVTLLVWAGLPKYKGDKRWQYPSANALIDAEWWQITEARNRGWEIELYCIGRKGGNITDWFMATDKKSVALRSAVYQLLGAQS